MGRFDFLVIGSGPAGRRAAIQAAKLDRRVALITCEMMGGVSVHTGTIPSKTLREAILYFTGWRQRGFYGRGHRLKKQITAGDLLQRITMTIGHEVEVLKDQLRRNGVEVITGIASFIDQHEISVAGPGPDARDYAADKILIATGTTPRRPPEIPFDDDTIIDSDGILNLQQLPRSVTVIGAGVIGCEYASMFNALDMEVTLVHERATIMDFVDRDLIDEFLHYQRDHGMRFRLGERVTKIYKDTTGKVITELASGKRVVSELLLHAAGRAGCLAALKLETVGLSANDRQLLQVNKHFQTAVPHIYAAGDVIGFPSLASTSMEQGRLAARHAFGEPCPAAPCGFPYGIYSVPEMSMIGMSEQQLTEQDIPYEIGVARFREVSRGQIMGLREGLLKLLVSLEDHRILGIHIIGDGATELIHIGQAVMVLGGKVGYFVDNAFNYPTLAEAYKVAALDTTNRLSACPTKRPRGMSRNADKSAA